MPGNNTPYTLKIFYTVQSLTHIARFGCDTPTDYPVGTEFDLMQLRGRDATLHSMDMYVDILATLIQPLYGAADDISHVELWRNSATSDESFYVSSYLLELNGTGSGGVTTRQVTYTFRTEGGHVAKFVLMEMNNGSDLINRPPYAVNAYSALSNFLVSDTTCLLGRDDTFVAAPLGFLWTQNEALYRRRFRAT